MLGFAILVGGRMRLATTATLILTLFFGWLTAYTDQCNQRQKAGEKMTYTVVVNGKEEVRDKTCVTDCGCFGDAMKGSIGRSLTPRESFYKDLILFIFLLPVFIASWRKPGIAFNTARLTGPRSCSAARPSGSAVRVNHGSTSCQPHPVAPRRSHSS